MPEDAIAGVPLLRLGHGGRAKVCVSREGGHLYGHALPEVNNIQMGQAGGVNR